MKAQCSSRAYQRPVKSVTRTGTDLDVATNNSSRGDTRGDAGFLRVSESINISSGH